MVGREENAIVVEAPAEPEWGKRLLPTSALRFPPLSGNFSSHTLVPDGFLSP
jgi:hypothetical protein